MVFNLPLWRWKEVDKYFIGLTRVLLFQLGVTSGVAMEKSTDIVDYMFLGPLLRPDLLESVSCVARIFKMLGHSTTLFRLDTPGDRIVW